MLLSLTKLQLERCSFVNCRPFCRRWSSSGSRCARSLLWTAKILTLSAIWTCRLILDLAIIQGPPGRGVVCTQPICWKSLDTTQRCHNGYYTEPNHTVYFLQQRVNKRCSSTEINTLIPVSTMMEVRDRP